MSKGEARGSGGMRPRLRLTQACDGGLEAKVISTSWRLAWSFIVEMGLSAGSRLLLLWFFGEFGQDFLLFFFFWYKMRFVAFFCSVVG